MVTRIGRNEPCPCGSGKKHKDCCGGNGEMESATIIPAGTALALGDLKGKKVKMLTQAGLNRCFLKLVKDAGGAINIPCAELDNIPKDEALAIQHNAENDSFHFKAVKVKPKSVILQPDKRLRLPRIEGKMN